MISEIINLAQSNRWVGVSENVEIAKGKNKFIRSWKQLLNQIKRRWLKK
jgi:hypothetical protein